MAVSDSHQDIRSLNEAIRAENSPDIILHAGDYAKDIRMANTGKSQLYCVNGNCDGSYSWDSETELLQVGITNILLTHGHQFGVKHSLEQLTQYALNQKVNVVVFGHTHRQMMENKNGIILLNPGSISKQKSPLPGYAMITTDGNGDLIKIDLKRL